MNEKRIDRTFRSWLSLGALFCLGAVGYAQGIQADPDLHGDSQGALDETPSHDGGLPLEGDVVGEHSQGLSISGEVALLAPQVKYPRFESCSASQETLLRAAWKRAYENVGETTRLLRYINDRPLIEHSKLWSEGFRAALREDNWSPRAWFGPYTEYRLDEVREAVDHALVRFTAGDYRIVCRDDSDEGPHGVCGAINPGTGKHPSANHIWEGTDKGKINICEGFWASNTSESARSFTLVHELFHWMWAQWKDGIWKLKPIQDRHGHCPDHCLVEPMYGDVKSYHLANGETQSEGHTDKAFQNNDNYAYFIHRFSSEVRADNLRYPYVGTPNLELAR